MIDIYFDKLYRYPRLQTCAGIAVPFEKDKLYDIQKIAIMQNEKPCMIQPKVTSRYENGSVRYLFVRFLADLPANSSEKLVLDTNSDMVNHDEGAVVVEQEDGYLVDLKALRFSVKNNTSSIFDMVDDTRKCYDSSYFEGPYLCDREGRHYQVKIGEWRAVECGPVCVILSAQGTHESDGRTIRFEVRLTGCVFKPMVEVSYRIINTTDEELDIQSLVFYMKRTGDAQMDAQIGVLEGQEKNDSTGCGDTASDNSESDGPIFYTTGIHTLPVIEKKADVENVRTMAAFSNYRTNFIIGKDGRQVSCLVDDKHLLREANEHFAEVLYGTFMADCTDGQDGFCITVYQAQQNYPKALKSCREGIAVMLVPSDSGKVVMQSGMAREQKFLIHFHKPDEPIKDLDNISLIYQMPDKPHISPKVFRDAGVMPDIFSEKLNDDVEISLAAKADGHSRCYGMLNWGDSVDKGYTVQGRGGGKPVWSNNEYDYPHSCALMYARTGVRRYLDYMTVSASHWMDVDVCHYSKDELRIGGQWEHTAYHCKNGVMVCSHEWVEGLLDYYHFTGDERGLETAVGIGENVLRLLSLPMYQTPGESNARETGWALRTLTALYVETSNKKWIERCDWIIDSFKTWEKEYGYWLSPYTDNTLIRVGFMISVAVGSVMRYYRVFPRDDIKEMIVREVDDLVENCMLDNGLFYYKELPSLARNGNNTLLLEALAAAYELTGNTDYLKAGLKTFEKAIKTPASGSVGSKQIIDDAVICNGDSTKGFAQSFIPLATFYHALSENNMTF